MGYLQYDPGPANFSKAIFSFWFRMPSAAVAAAQAQFASANVADGIDNNDGSFPSVLLGKIPLVTFGPNPTATASDSGGTLSQEISPGFIGINCGMRVLKDTATPDATPSLCAQLPYSGQDSAFITNPGPFQTTWSLPNRFEIGYWGGFGTFFEFGPTQSDPDDGSTAMGVSPDSWHHVIFSLDLTSPTASKVWIALDDVDKNAGYLWPAYNGTGANNVSSSATYMAAVGQGSAPAGGSLQIASHPFGIPGHGAFTDWVYNVEMAEFQMFTGITLDTSVLANRRLFVSDVGRPVAGTVAADALGVAPVIKLHGQANWISGINSGSIGSAMTPFGTITSFTPGP